MKTTKTTARGLARFEYFAQCEDSNRLPSIAFEPCGCSAAEAFHAHETHGLTLPCREPVLLARALNGKARHGITVAALAQDYLDRILFADELRANYPDWVRAEVIAQCRKLALAQVGFVPSFVASGEDWTTLEKPRFESAHTERTS
jgi:hypothetical protein